MKGMYNDLINYRLTRAYETLKEAETMIANDFYNASINRIYYSCYYAVSALLLTKEITSSTHKGTRQMFWLHFIQTNLIEKKFAKFYSDIFDRRQSGDYDDFITFNFETSERLLKSGEEFINEIAELLKKSS